MHILESLPAEIRLNIYAKYCEGKTCIVEFSVRLRCHEDISKRVRIGLLQDPYVATDRKSIPLLLVSKSIRHELRGFLANDSATILELAPAISYPMCARPPARLTSVFRERQPWMSSIVNLRIPCPNCSSMLRTAINASGTFDLPNLRKILIVDEPSLTQRLFHPFDRATSLPLPAIDKSRISSVTINDAVEKFNRWLEIAAATLSADEVASLEWEMVSPIGRAYVDIAASEEEFRKLWFDGPEARDHPRLLHDGPLAHSVVTKNTTDTIVHTVEINPQFQKLRVGLENGRHFERYLITQH